MTLNQETYIGFGGALLAMEKGHRVARAGWNGKGLFVYKVPASIRTVDAESDKLFFGEDALVSYNPYMAIKNVDNSVSTWVPSVNDCFAKDWYVLKTV